MAGKAGLKAGLIGGAVVLVLTLLGMIQVLSCFCCGLNWLVYLGIGVLAGSFLDVPRTAGSGASAGALAGAISGAVGGIASAIISVVRMFIAGPGQMVSAIPPQQLQQLRDLGIDRDMLDIFMGTGGVAIGSGVCCLGSLFVGAVLGAIGGAIYASMKKV
ncbi:MAG: hypothetical protein GX620_03495 [Chloroflexi bacterium]|nr:hypothetical protein [Chloroflexota bacterium]